MTCRVLLVDDHALVRAGIRGLIDQIDGFTVVAEASGTQEALTIAAACEPALVVTDISMGKENGLDLLGEMKIRAPSVAVLILSMHTSEELVSEALRLGAAAYLLKEAAPAELEIALRAAMRGELYLSPAVSRQLIERYVRPAPVADDGILQTLTPRQLQILRLIALRKSVKEIAFDLDLSEKTIAAHRAQLMERTGARDLVGLVFFAMKHRLGGPVPAHG